jgi:hypothetical protein
MHRRFKAGEESNLRTAAYEVGAREFAEDGELDGFVDEAFSQSLDLPCEVLIRWEWEAGFPGNGNASIQLIDFGSGHKFIAYPPDNDMDDGWGWEVIGEVDQDDPAATVSVVIDGFAMGAGFDSLPVPLSIDVAPPLGRRDVRDAYWLGLHIRTADAAIEDNLQELSLSRWPEVARWIEAETGTEWPISTRDEREALLDEYLDRTLTGAEPRTPRSIWEVDVCPTGGFFAALTPGQRAEFDRLMDKEGLGFEEARQRMRVKMGFNKKG